MPEPTPSKLRPLARAGLPALGRFLSSAIPRAYALALIILIGGLTWMAVRYLFTSLLRPSAAPAQITAIPKRLDRQALFTDPASWQATLATENPRTPLSHYHRIDAWIQPDPHNNCTQSGCHAPLPHGRKKEVRAFLNMHTTSLHCATCHMETHQPPLQLTWYNLQTGQPQPAPAILDAFGILTSAQASGAAPELSHTLVTKLIDDLRAAADQASDHRPLADLADHFAALRPGSKPFNELIAAALSALPRFFRGEYGAKLTAVDEQSNPVLGNPGADQFISDFLARRNALSGIEEDSLIKHIHPRKRDRALVCTDCHQAESSLIPFAKLGYPPARIDALINPAIFRMVEHIDAGRPFNMPGELLPATENPLPTQPARTTPPPTQQPEQPPRVSPP